MIEGDLRRSDALAAVVAATFSDLGFPPRTLSQLARALTFALQTARVRVLGAQEMVSAGSVHELKCLPWVTHGGKLPLNVENGAFVSKNPVDFVENRDGGSPAVDTLSAA